MAGRLQSALASLASHSQDPLFRQLFARSPAAMVITRASDGLILEANDAYCALLERPRDEVLGRTTIALELWEQPLDRETLVAAIARDGRVDEVEVRFRVRSGEHRVLLASMVPIDVAGCPCLLLVAWDVTERRRAEAARAEADRRHTAILRSALDGFAVIDSEGRFREVNDAMCRMLGYGADELLAMGIADVEACATASDTAIDVGRIADRGADRFESRQRRRDGRLIDVEVSAAYVPFDGGQVVAFQHDITARKAVDEALRASEDRYRRLHESLTDAFVLVDMSGRLIDWNQAYQNMLGYTPDELRRLTYVDLTPAKWHAMEAHIVGTQVLPDGQSGVYEKEYVRKDGTVIPVELRTFLLRDRSGGPEAMWAIVRNIAERKDAERRVRHMAYHDWLTGLPNRGLFFDRLAQAISHAKRDGRRVGVLFIDLDGFKGVNERFGHDAGDIVLKEAARRFSTCVRAVDTVARMGGDEFVVIVGELGDRREAGPVAKKLLDAIAPAIALPGRRECFVGASIGISVYPDDGAGMDALLTAADTAMYHSKRAGGGRSSYWTGAAGAGQPEKVEWLDLDDAHSVGVAEIDGQHAEIAGLVNRIAKAVWEHTDPSRLGMMFSDLATKASLHFETEERLMERFGYPGRDAHAAAHRHLVADLVEFASRFEEGEALLMLEWLKEWLVVHIDAEDKALGAFLREQANRS